MCFFLKKSIFQGLNAQLRSLLTKDDQFRLHRLEVDYVKGPEKHSQGDEQHGRADAVEKNFNGWSTVLTMATFYTAVTSKSFKKILFQVSHEHLHCLSMCRGQNTVPNPCVKVSLTDLHAVHDETQEDESIVAVVNFHIFYNPLTHLSEVAGFWKLPLIHKAGPRSNGHATLVKPFFGYTGRNSFREPEPVEEKRDVARAVQWQGLFNQPFTVFNILMKVTLGAEM